MVTNVYVQVSATLVVCHLAVSPFSRFCLQPKLPLFPAQLPLTLTLFGYPGISVLLVQYSPANKSPVPYNQQQLTYFYIEWDLLASLKHIVISC